LQIAAAELPAQNSDRLGPPGAQFQPFSIAVLDVRREPRRLAKRRRDPARMRQVFANLLDNAIKYTPAAGRISISSRRADGNVEVNFGDTGPGIREADVPRIWERLYRTDKSRSEHGLGLGLSLVKAIVEAHQGRVQVTSKEGKGSEFRISLPLGEAGDARAFDGL
jgi:signal transduction histidine kinase